MRVFSLFVAFSLCTIGLLQAQPRALERYEQEMKLSDDGFTIISLKENGLALVRDWKYEDGKHLWKIALLDTTLNETWSGSVDLQPRFNLIGFDAPEDGNIYLLFREGEADTGDLSLIKLDGQTKETQRFDIKHEFNLRLTHFSMLANSAIVGGYVTQEPAVLLFDLTTNTTKVVPGFFLQNTELLDVRTNKNGTFNTVLMERHTRVHRNLVIKTFDATGVLLLEDKVEIDRNLTVLTAITNRLVREELMIFGTYSLGNSQQASGYFTYKVDPFSEKKTMEFYELTSLNHFLDYMKPKRAARTKMKAQRRREAGKIPIYKSHVQPLYVSENKNGFLLLSEAYNSGSDLNQPYWNNSYYPYYGYGFAPYRFAPYGNQYYSSPYNYDATNRSGRIEMIESVVTAFDSSGKLEWDHSIKLDGRKRDGLEQVSDMLVQNDRTSLMFKEEQELIIRSLEPKSDSVRSDTVQIPMKNPMDVVRFEPDQAAGVRHWYKNYAFTWGYQSIRNRSAKEEDPTRYVFYLVRYEWN